MYPLTTILLIAIHIIHYTHHRYYTISSIYTICTWAPLISMVIFRDTHEIANYNYALSTQGRSSSSRGWNNKLLIMINHILFVASKIINHSQSYEQSKYCNLITYLISILTLTARRTFFYKHLYHVTKPTVGQYITTLKRT